LQVQHFGERAKGSVLRETKRDMAIDGLAGKRR